MPVLEVEEQQLDFAALLVALYEKRFTGAITLNFQRGVPLVAEYSKVRISLARVATLDKV